MCDQIVEEKKIMDQIDFPFIIKFYGAIHDKYNFYFLEEFVCGIELFDAMRSRGKLSYFSPNSSPHTAVCHLIFGAGEDI